MRTDEDAGKRAAIYCRISHIKDDDQTGVERQERICRELAAKIGVTVQARHVFIDPSRSAWQRDRKRPGWDGLLEAIDAGELDLALIYHPDRLMRQPWDLEMLLHKTAAHPLILRGKTSRRDLSRSESTRLNSSHYGLSRMPSSA